MVLTGKLANCSAASFYMAFSCICTWCILVVFVVSMKFKRPLGVPFVRTVFMSATYVPSVRLHWCEFQDFSQQSIQQSLTLRMTSLWEWNMRFYLLEQNCFRNICGLHNCWISFFVIFILFYFCTVIQIVIASLDPSDKGLYTNKVLHCAFFLSEWLSPLFTRF